MGRHTPPLSAVEQKKYLEDYLVTDLRWLLRAATEWHVQHTLNLCIPGYEGQVFAMDSAFLHARTLFEFLTKCTSHNYYGANAFGIAPLVSAAYDGPWKCHLHAALMHAQDRSRKELLKSFDGLSEKGLHEMPVDFAREVVRLWREFSSALEKMGLADLSSIASDGLATAVREATAVAHSLMAQRSSEIAAKPPVTIPPITW